MCAFIFPECIFPGHALPSAHNIKVDRNAETFYDCRALCAQHGPACTHFTYQTAEKTCYLKNIVESAPEIMTSAPGFVSGNNFCERDSK